MEADIAIIIVSDSRSAGEAEDASGPAAVAAVTALGLRASPPVLVPDEVESIQAAIRSACERHRVVLTSGGTGFSPRDLTPEATAPLLQKRADNVSEWLRAQGASATPFSYLSRGVAGICDGALVVNLPGSPAAVRQCVAALGPLLPSIMNALAGQPCDAAVHGALDEHGLH